MKQHILSYILLTVLLSASAFGQHATLVVTDQVTELEFQDQITLIGRTRAIISSKIVAEVAGVIESIDANEGNSVQSGSPLLSIDRKRAELSYRAKEAQMKQAQVEAELAHGTFETAKELYTKSLISESRLDSATAWAAITQESYVQLQAESGRLKLDLDNCIIRAPFDGYTIRQLTDVGQWVNVGDPVYEVVDLSRVKVTVDLPERHFGQLKNGSLVNIIVSGDDENTVHGKVTGIAPDASVATHTFPVTITVDNYDGRLGGGMLVRVTLNLKSSFTSLAVSKDAIIWQGPQTMIYTVVEGAASPIRVTISSANGEMIGVTGPGLTVGMSVVVRGNERIFPGSPVMIEGEAPPAASSEGESREENTSEQESVTP